MAAAQMYPKNLKISILAIEVEPFTSTDLFLEMGRPEIGCYIGNKANKTPSHDKERHIKYWSVFMGKLNKGNGSDMGAMLQAQQSQQKPNANPSVQAVHREL